MLHFYDGQIRKFLTQFIRILSNFSVETGKGKDDTVTLRQVPVVYGDMTRQVANIIRQNSENALQYAPRIAAYVRELNYDRERMQNPYHIEKQHLRERNYNETTKQYDNYFNEINNIAKFCSGIRRMGSAAIDLAYVASGKLDGFWERNLNIWDVSSGVLLVKEAGGKISEPNGDEWNVSSKDVLASNLLIHDIIKDKIL